MYAFRCKTCGHLEGSAHAGECPTPAACRCCGGGVTFSKKGIRTMEPDNWEVLADATPERLAELGLTPEEVAKHAPAPKGTPATVGTHHERTASDGATVTGAAEHTK